MERAKESSSARQQPVLIIFGGLPGSGKTTIARELARRLGAMYLRIDSIEQAIRNAAPERHPVNEEGYRVAYAVAKDNLLPGRTVIADSVNPCKESRDAWLAVAQGAVACATEVEVICSDVEVHRQRLEARAGDIPGLQLPTWEMVIAREYEPWPRVHIVVDTAGRGVSQCVAELEAALTSPL